MDELLNDVDHWRNLNPPLSPNAQEVKLYEEIVRDRGPICLLGMTRQLIHICDYMVDLNPSPHEKPVIKSDWAEFNTLAEAIMGDGVLNLCGLGLVPKLMSKCDLLVCRVFLKKLEGMKYAKYFPNHFSGSRRVIPTQPDVVMVVWEK